MKKPNKSSVPGRKRQVPQINGGNKRKKEDQNGEETKKGWQDTVD